MANYRKIYEEHYQTTLTDDMDIHHIDENREHNDPSNLLMLPRDLHQRYHQWKREYDKMLLLSKCDGQLRGSNQYDFLVMAQFGAVCQECMVWVSYKVQLDSSKSLRCENG